LKVDLAAARSASPDSSSPAAQAAALWPPNNKVARLIKQTKANGDLMVS
jgi:hypothetical protein